MICDGYDGLNQFLKSSDFCFDPPQAAPPRGANCGKACCAVYLNCGSGTVDKWLKLSLFDISF